MKYKSKKFNITQHINKDFRDYAIYTLQARGIPSFDDGLTAVQRIILKNAKASTEKTLSLVGSCISSGYAHGDSSLAGAISRLAREFNSAENLLEGKGFWGSPVVHNAAAARYTSIKMNPKIKPLFKYEFLDEQIDEVWQPLHFDVPIGLSTMTMGIAVGYKSLILPRKIQDIQRFMDGNLKTVKPFFKNFSGKVSKHKLGWLITGSYTVDKNKRVIHVNDIPHLLKYSTFLSKLLKDFDSNELSCKVKNDSAKVVDLKIVYKDSEFKKVLDIVEKHIKILVQENIVFVIGNSVITYKCIEDYLTDYKIRIHEIKAKEAVYYFELETFNLAYERAKLKFLKFMTKKRTRTEVTEFLKQFESRISTKLDAIKLTRLNNETIKETEAEIKRLEKLVVVNKKEVNRLTKVYEKAKSKFVFSGSIAYAEHNTEEEPEEINGIPVFHFDEIEEE